MLTRVREAAGNLPRLWKRVILICYDVVALAGALWLSYALRFGLWTPPATLQQWEIIATGPAIALPIFVRMGLYRAVIRFLPDQALWTIIRAMALATVGWVIIAFVSLMVAYGSVPRSVPLLYFLFGTILVAGSRFAARAFLGGGGRPRRGEKPVLIFGAGRPGIQLANALRYETRRMVVGFLDEDRTLQGHDVAGLRVYAPEYLPSLVRQFGVEEVILSIPALSAGDRKRIVNELSEHGLKVRTLPPITDVVQGRYLVSQIREIDIDELLGRSSVPADTELVREVIEGRTIMVTGAGGSIGSELCRLVLRWAPRQLVLFEANEFALYQIERELTENRSCPVVPVLGSITDRDRVDHALRAHGVEVVFHAAAHKHVPLVEANALEGIRNNVFGTLMVAERALASGVKRFVLISSDKAVRPTNVMGATKRWAEMIVAQMAREAAEHQTDQLFCAVRFGNVLGSNGSVVPLFKEQIARGGPLTLTDERMTRYFMSIHEAAELIVQASALSRGGDIFLLEMGQPVLIKDLAENMIKLAGLTLRDAQHPDGDIELVVTGRRPGEKLYEELFYDESNASRTRHPKILRSENADGSHVDVREQLARLRAALDAQDEMAARSILFDAIRFEGMATAPDVADPPKPEAAMAGLSRVEETRTSARS